MSARGLRKPKGDMRKDSTIILLVSVLVTAAVFGGAYYMSVVYHSAEDPFRTEAETPEFPRANSGINPNSVTGATGAVDASSETSGYEIGSRTDTAIKCHHPDVGEFWTNAATCEGADLDNRLSYSAPLATTPYRDRYNESGYKTPSQMAADDRGDRKPNLRLLGKSPPPGLPPECKFPVGKALEIERDLAAARNPYESTWRKSYCEFRCEVMQDNCPIQDDYFYFEYRSKCHGTEHQSC